MKLTVKDRVALPYLFPQSHNMVTMLAVRDLYKKIKLTPDEEKRIKLTVTEGRVAWDDKENFEIDVTFNNLQLNLLKERVSFMDKQKAINEDILGFCIKLKDEK